MRVHTPAPDVVQLSRFGSFSCHLVKGSDGLTLIDTGLPGGSSGVLRAAAGLGLPIRRILITHGHNDHCGSLDGIAKRVGTIEVAASARTVQLLSGDRNLKPEDQRRRLRGGFSKCKTIPNAILAPNETVAGFKAVFTPGHSPDHVSYFHEETGYLFTGDALHTAGGRLAVSGEFRVTFPFLYFATWDRALALDSACRLRDLRPRALFPAHGPALINPAQALDEAIAYATRAFKLSAGTFGSRQAA
jgi:glyoxylase-like metal-dependent hydrolase (beta-lactamase superfamily II)